MSNACGLPTADQLKQLPLTHVVAYAVRNALRVRPLFDQWPDSQPFRAAVDEAIASAIVYALTGISTARVARVARVADAAVNAARSSEAGRTAKDAADAATYATYSVRAADACRGDDAARTACEAAAAAIQATELSATSAADDFVHLQSSLTSFASLSQMTRHLWLREEPGWFASWKTNGLRSIEERVQDLLTELQQDPLEATRRILSTYVDRGDAPPEVISRFYTALAGYYIACGGSGLEIARDERKSIRHVTEDAS